jgi:hypothetical protein
MITVVASCKHLLDVRKMPFKFESPYTLLVRWIRSKGGRNISTPTLKINFYLSPVASDAAWEKVDLDRRLV